MIRERDLTYQTMTRSSVLHRQGCDVDDCCGCAIELDCDHDGCEDAALFVIQHRIGPERVTIARCRPHSTITRGMTP